MEKIYVITRTQRVTYGHGDSMDEQMLATQGAYGSDGFCPAFETLEAANEWIKEHGERWWKVTELSVNKS